MSFPQKRVFSNFARAEFRADRPLASSGGLASLKWSWKRRSAGKDGATSAMAVGQFEVNDPTNVV
jgi:hypothetical protein